MAQDIDFAIRHKGTAEAGSACFIALNRTEGAWFDGSGRPRGMATIDEDGARLFYRVSRSEAGAFRKWAEWVFCDIASRGVSDGSKRLSGRFPSYYVESRS